MSTRTTTALAELLHKAARPLTGAREDFDPILDLVGDARIVFLGEASHGTHEFYRARAEITKRLIQERGFVAVAAEADWPDAYRVNRYVRGVGSDGDASQALSGFLRFPQWMWRNADILDFVTWLRAFNDAALGSARKVGFYGLDLYSLHASMATVLDNLMHRRLMADCVVAFTNPQDRLGEYAATAAHSRFLTTELVPQIEGSLQLRGDPRGRVLMGASFGGVATLSAAVRSPGFYGALLLESPSLRFTEATDAKTYGDVFEPVVRFVNSVRARPKKVTERIFLTYGAFEPLAAPDRAMVDVLGRMADELRVVEGLDGHNWINWRDRLLDGLGWLFPGEARLIYP